MGKPKSLKSTIKSLTLQPICMQTIPRTHSSRSLSPPPSRFFFSPYTTKSIMEERHPDVPLGSTHVVLSSDDPYSDFRTSMEEMVEALGVRSLGAFRELLSCYLKLNGRENHRVIMLVFLDLLLVGSLSDVSLESSSLGERRTWNKQKRFTQIRIKRARAGKNITLPATVTTRRSILPTTNAEFMGSNLELSQHEEVRLTEEVGTTIDQDRDRVGTGLWPGDNNPHNASNT